MEIFALVLLAVLMVGVIYNLRKMDERALER